jgi:hypothetical protein
MAAKVTAADRRKYGMKGSAGRRGKYPVKSVATAKSALRLRGHGKGVSRKAVVAKVARYATRTHNASLRKAVARARAVDRGRSSRSRGKGHGRR